jgi:hypothetical protein
MTRSVVFRKIRKGRVKMTMEEIIDELYAEGGVRRSRL